MNRYLLRTNDVSISTDWEHRFVQASDDMAKTYAVKIIQYGLSTPKVNSFTLWRVLEEDDLLVMDWQVLTTVTAVEIFK